jgi:hypothetical protein
MNRRSSSSTSSFGSVHRRAFLKAAAGSALAWVGLGRRARTTLAGQTSAEVNYPPARAVTHGPKHHFFAYYDKCPWDKTGRYLLAMEIDFYDRQPNPGEPLTVGMVDLKDNDRYIPLDKTLAWCWQQGTMLQWLNSAPDREIIYNAYEDDRYISIIRDVHGGKTRKLPRPIYAVSQDATQAVTLDFDRLGRTRPGYGYIAGPEKYKDDPAPEMAGLYWMDLKTGQNKQIVSIAQAAAHKPLDTFGRGAHHWFNHLQFNPSGTRFLFLHRWGDPARRWGTRLYTAKPDGSDLRLIVDTGMVSHFDWRDDDTILAYANGKDRKAFFFLINALSGDMQAVGKGVLVQDGHCSYSPDRRWILNDTYPDRQHMQTLMLYRPADNKRIDIGRFYQPPKLTGRPFRVDLHPRWNRDGTQVCIDSSHEEPTRQMYVVDVGRITKG